jgi:hypothetical protein
MKYIKPVHIYHPVYCENFYVYYGQDSKKTIESVRYNARNNEIKDISCNVHGQCLTLTNCITVIWTRKRSVPALTHEVFHAVFNMMRLRNIPCTADTEEMTAYEIEWLMREILNKKTGGKA